MLVPIRQPAALSLFLILCLTVSTNRFDGVNGLSGHEQLQQINSEIVNDDSSNAETSSVAQEEQPAQRKCLEDSTDPLCNNENQPGIATEDPLEQTKSAWIEELLRKSDDSEAAADLVEQIRLKRTRTGLHSLRRACLSMCSKCACGVILLTPSYGTDGGNRRLKAVAASVGAAAKLTGKGAKKVGKKVAKGAKKVGKKVAKGAKKVGKKVAKGAKKVGKKVKKHKKGAKKAVLIGSSKKKRNSKKHKKAVKKHKKSVNKHKKNSKKHKKAVKKPKKAVKKPKKAVKKPKKVVKKPKKAVKKPKTESIKTAKKARKNTFFFSDSRKSFKGHSTKTSVTGRSSKKLEKAAGTKAASADVDNLLVSEESPDFDGDLSMMMFMRAG